MSASPTPQPPEPRNRALLHGTTALICTVIGFLGLGSLIAALQVNDRWAVGLIRLALAAADAAMIYAVWQLGRARDRRWDLRGWVSLLAMAAAWPVLLTFVIWTVFALFVLVTGRPLRLFGD